MRLINGSSADAVGITAGALRRSQVVLVPTDTVYGLAALPQCADAMDRIFRMKGRPADTNLPVIVGDVQTLTTLGVDVSECSWRLIDAFWPGALTIVFGFASGLQRPDWLAHRQEVGVRLPQNAFLQAVSRYAGPLVVTSANVHGEPTTANPGRAAESLLEAPDLLVDDGLLASMPSTLVNVRYKPLLVERVGAVPPAKLEAVIGEKVGSA